MVILNIILLIILVFIGIIIGYLNSPHGKGFLGELFIKSIIGKTQIGKQYVINDYIFVIDDKSSQIDHILINPNGIFIIETKNYSGRIYGKDYELNWTQVLNYGNTKNYFYNPVKQNATHAYRLAKILPIDAPIIPVVVFIKNNTNFTQSLNVYNTTEFYNFINKPNTITLNPEQMLLYYKCLIKNKSNLTKKEHIAKITQTQNNINSNICPRCGGNLIERKGKYGEFLGCENYPKCLFVRKHKKHL